MKVISHLPRLQVHHHTVEGMENISAKKQNWFLFLEERDIEPLARCWMDWQQANKCTQKGYIKHSSEIVKSVLSVVYPDNYAHVWKELKVSDTMDKMMGSDSVQLSSDNSYLEALAEAYTNAASWGTCQQVLSIMTGVTSGKKSQGTYLDSHNADTPFQIFTVCSMVERLWSQYMYALCHA